MAKLWRWDLGHGVELPGFGQWALDTRGTISAEGLREVPCAGKVPKFW